MPSLCDIVKSNLEKKLGKGLPKIFFRARCSYEKYFCHFIGGTHVTKEGDRRYWDCGLPVENGEEIKIELKKTSKNSSWLDEVRYSEILLAKRGIHHKHLYFKQAATKTVTLFIKTRERRLISIFIIDTDKLVEFLDLEGKDKNWPYSLIDRYHYTEGKINSQRRVLYTQMEKIADHVLYFDESAKKAAEKNTKVTRRKTVKKNTKVTRRKTVKKNTKVTRRKVKRKILRESLKVVLDQAKEISNKNGIFTRPNIMKKIPEIREKCSSILNGATPQSSLDGCLQEIRNAGYIDFMGKGIYLIKS